MKKLLIGLVYVLSSASVFANQNIDDEIRKHVPSCSVDHSGYVFSDSLKNVIAPNAQALTKEAIMSGRPIFAYQASLGVPQGPNFIHTACYINGLIKTCIGHSKNSINKPDIGEQIFFLYTGDGVSYRQFTSNCWALETICGMQYIVHYYTGFKVCTNSVSQFVVAF